MSVSVSMPQLGESVTEGTVTRWLKREGEHVQADEPLLEVSTDKVDTEIPSPVSGVLRGITVAEDETVAVGAELAVIDEDGAGGGQAPAAQEHQEQAAQPEPAQPEPAQPEPAQPEPAQPEPAQQPEVQPAAAEQEQPEPSQPEPVQQPEVQPAAADQEQPAAGYTEPAATAPYGEYQPQAPEAPAAQPAGGQPGAYQPAAAYPPAGYDEPGNGQAAPQFTDTADGPYVTPLVRKLAAEHGIDLASITGTGVGGRIRKQDILDAAAATRGAQAAPPATYQAAAPSPPAAPAQAPPAQAAPAPAAPAPAAPTPAAAPAPVAATTAFAPSPASAPEAEQSRPRTAIVPSSLRGTTERMSRARQVIAQRMVESLQTSAQLTTVVEADVTAIARLRERAKAAFEAREGVKLSFLPFFALATVEALKVHPRLNAVIDTASSQVTYHDDEHLGIAVDTERGLMVPVIKNSGDLNIGGLARKIADLAERTRAGHVSPDDLSGGTFTLTNTGSRGALFDTPIINQPQVGILGTGTVVKRAVVVEDATLGEVITVRSMVYLALTYDHRLVDGADAARFLLTVKERLEEGAFETELGL
ncbi:MAG TPA: 2-oxo acid dehydrogenase subunit E2 [Streptosporangiaceae bacterium]|jgi:2-oxoglutarate dehydrogenase E2 component (dihydrolipoamide succinyltransferase)|nr:2-oxo acid dehydrogenase subunit E2 [Streptosporangiaceae bacterium]